MASLLAPDSGEETTEEDIDVVSGDQQDQGGGTKQWPMFPIVNYYQALLHARPGGQHHQCDTGATDSS